MALWQIDTMIELAQKSKQKATAKLLTDLNYELLELSRKVCR